MKALMKKHLKNQKGLTLIELLAVVVILAIIAAIAIPSIGAIINNTRIDAHIANAEQLVNSVKTAEATNVKPSTPNTYSLSQLVDEGLIEDPEVPGVGGKYSSGSQVVIGKTDDGDKTYSVTLGTYISNKDIVALRGDDRRSLVTLP